MASTETVDGVGAAVGVPVRLGKYTLLTRLATGGMGEVYVAQMAGAAGFEKRVVIKRILPQLARDEHFVQMFLDEARITAQLNHPNICQVFELGEVGGEYYISMEYLEGVPLSNLLEKYAPGGLDPRLVAGIMIQACEGLAHAHEFCDPGRQIDGIVHRDVSPQNLFVTTAGLVKVLDFGVAKLYREGSKTVTHSAKGKYLYMSPEQVQGEPVDRRSDIFALGVVLFEAMTGRNLFRRNTEFQTLQAIISGDRARVSDVREGVPQAVSDVVDRALCVSRAQRYASTRTLAEALTRALVPLGGPATITELAEFVRREHTADITAQRERIRRASAQMQAVALPEGLSEEDVEPDRWSRSSVSRLGSSPGSRSGRDSDVIGLAGALPDRATPDDEPAGGRSSSSVIELDGLELEGHASAPLRGGRRYARWGILIGAVLAVALWGGHYLLGRASATASAPTVTGVAPTSEEEPSEPEEPAHAMANPGADDPAGDQAGNQAGDRADDRADDRAGREADGDPLAGALAGTRSDDDAGREHTAAEPSAGDDGNAGGEDADGTDDRAAAGDGARTAEEASAGEDSGDDASAREASGEQASATREAKRRKRRSRARHVRRRGGDSGRRGGDSGRRGGDSGRHGAQKKREDGPKKAKTGYLTVDSSPYAEIFVDGRKLGITPLVRIPLTVGRHVVRAVAANGDVETRVIRVRPGQTASRRIRFADKRK